MKRTIHEILMALHTIPTTMEGDNPMDRIKNAETEINQYVIKARIEELETIDPDNISKTAYYQRVAELKKGIE